MKYKKYIKRIRADLDQLLATRAANGPYRHLVRKWGAVSDLNLAADVLNVDVFRAQLKPVKLPVEKIKSYLVIAPHQDDEAIGAGGTLLLAKKAGAKISILFVTDGAQRTETYAKTVVDTALIRKQEAMNVCDKLNAAYYELNISNILPQPKYEDVLKLSEIIAEVKPEVILSPWLLDSPAKHRMANHLLYLANKHKIQGNFEVWGYQVHNSLMPNGIVDITEVAEEKRDLIEFYKSQNENYYRYDHQAMGMAAWNSRYLGRNSEKCYAEIFFTLPHKEFFKLIDSFYLKNLKETYLDNAGLVEHFEKLRQKMI